MVLRVVDLYNRHDAPGLYALFAPRAKSQFSLADLTRRMPIIQERAEKVEGLRYLRAETGLRDGGLVLHMLVYHIHASGRLGNWEGEMKFSFAEDLHSFDGWTVKLDPTSSS
jgi:hypothetical protein